MGQYMDLHEAVYSIFGAPEWVSENITTIPLNFAGTTNAAEYIRVSVLTEGRGVNMVSNTGTVIIDIFSASGLGLKRTNQIADKLDQYLRNRMKMTATHNVQFSNSSMSYMGPCRDNNALHRSMYSIPFNYFGVTN